MYKVYLETTNNYDKIWDLANIIKAELVRQDNIIVYINEANYNNIEENLDVNLNVYVKIQDESKIKGVEVIINEKSKVSNGLAKEIYKSLQKVYYDKSIDNGVIYISDVVGKNNIPATIVNVINKENSEDKNWLNNNFKEIGIAISNGIITSFKLKKC